MYRRIGNIEATHREVGDLLIKLVGKEEAYWWFAFTSQGQAGKNVQTKRASLNYSRNWS